MLYNTAATQMSSRLVETSEEMWDATIATNLSASFWSCRAAIPHMLAGPGGAIVNTATTLGPPGSEGPIGLPTAAEAGLIALTRQIAGEYGPHIRANVIASGSIDPDDVARVALFLAGDASAYISGAVIPCDRRPSGASVNAATRVIVVTGGASGLGEAIVSRFASDGDLVVVADVDELRARQVADNLTAAGLPAESETVDVTSEGEVAAMFDAIAERHGRLDALVCSAAVEARSSVVDCTDDEWQQVLDVNVKGPFLCCKHGIPAIASSGGGAVVLLGSVLGAIGSPGYAAYCASKGALANLARQAAIEHARRRSAGERGRAVGHRWPDPAPPPSCAATVAFLCSNGAALPQRRDHPARPTDGGPPRRVTNAGYQRSRRRR